MRLRIVKEGRVVYKDTADGKEYSEPEGLAPSGLERNHPATAAHEIVGAGPAGPRRKMMPAAKSGGPPSGARWATQADLLGEPEPTVSELIQAATNSHRFITWSMMHAVKYGAGPFVNYHISDMTEAARICLVGADALLVDAQAQFSAKAPWEAHWKWLLAHGFSAVPQVKK